MLVLTRKVGERIQIGSNIVLTVAEVANGKVRLAIDAPRNVAIWREELLMRAVKDAEASFQLAPA